MEVRPDSSRQNSVEHDAGGTCRMVWKVVRRVAQQKPMKINGRITKNVSMDYYSRYLTNHTTVLFITQEHVE